MSNVFAVLWFITLFAFIILVSVKRSKRLAAGDNYKADPAYLKVSNIKRLQDFTEKSWQYAEHMKTPDFLHGEDKETIRKANRA